MQRGIKIDRVLYVTGPQNMGERVKEGMNKAGETKFGQGHTKLRLLHVLRDNLNNCINTIVVL